jgi:hypothetical protein
MTAPLTVPTPQPEPRHPQPGEPYVYDHIPRLGPHRPTDTRGSLLPDGGGLPGLTYYQVPVGLKKLAQNDGWLEIVGCKTYTIVGPSGTIDCELLAKGAIIKGLDPMSSARPCLTDELIFEVTGLDPKTGWSPRPKATLSKPTTKTSTHTKET